MAGRMEARHRSHGAIRFPKSLAMEPTDFDPQTMVLDPPHLKKVFYLDQFAISEMVKALDTRSKAHARVNPFWQQVFEALERVCKLQLVVCPWSPIHQRLPQCSGGSA